ncbi:hypothetical protein Leryth_007869 [Lithospermum erythrorhizon]|nr:hypothetical protein Leryth_007869 [Lithospermum erythrorhizon]
MYILKQMSGGGDYNDTAALLGGAATSDLETGQTPRSKSIGDLVKRLDRNISSSGKRSSLTLRNSQPLNSPGSGSGSDHGGFGNDEVLGDGAPPEWALLLVGCLLGVATGLCVAAFNRGVHVIHEYVWAGTPNEGASWLRLQRLGDTWHRILLIPVLGGVIVGMLHGLLEILLQIKQATSSEGQGFDVLAGVFPTIKAVQAAVTLGTGCSLGPEGPSVDIGKSCAYGFSVMMENNRERRIALVAAGAAAGISSGFNAAVAGCFFAIETVLRPLRAENSPPFTTAMIILSSVISSTVSNAVLGELQAFTVPTYDLKSAAELPLYLILGMLCGVYPGILYWGFTNVDEILHTGKTASAPGIGLLAQLAAAKVVATALCKGSGLVGGLYAPSLMIGAAVGAVFGGVAGDLVNSAIPGNAAVAQPQAYALVGMAATLASVCSVPLTSVLLLFELTKDYRILLPLMGAVGLAIWVPSLANQPKEGEASVAKNSSSGYSVISPTEEKSEESSSRRPSDENGLELNVMDNSNSDEMFEEDILMENLKVSHVMSTSYLKISSTQTLKEALNFMHNGKQNCVFVVDTGEYLVGILTYGDIRRCLSKNSGDGSNSDLFASNVCSNFVSSICTRGISCRGKRCGLLTCYPDTDLATAKQLMEAKGIKQLPVVKRIGDFQKERKHKIVAVLFYDSIWNYLRDEVKCQKLKHPQREEDSNDEGRNPLQRVI